MPHDWSHCWMNPAQVNLIPYNKTPIVTSDAPHLSKSRPSKPMWSQRNPLLNSCNSRMISLRLVASSEKLQKQIVLQQLASDPASNMYSHTHSPKQQCYQEQAYQCRIIGGSGLYSMQGLTTLTEHTLETPYGTPSAPIEGQLGGIDARLFFIPRHGRGHTLQPIRGPLSSQHLRAQITGRRVDILNLCSWLTAGRDRTGSCGGH